MTELLLYMSELLLLESGHGQYSPYFYGAESVLTDGDPRHGIQDDHVPFMTRGHSIVFFILMCQLELGAIAMSDMVVMVVGGDN